MDDHTHEVDIRQGVRRSAEGVGNACHAEGSAVVDNVVVEEGMWGLQQQLRDLQVRRH